jgi:hypothetical protein
MRKVVQVSSTVVVWEDGDNEVNVIALCNDGTIWRWAEYNGSWGQIAPIPQPKGDDNDDE